MPLQAFQVTGKDRHREGGCKVRANAGDSETRSSGPRAFNVTRNASGASSAGAGQPGQDKRTFARDAGISRGRAFLIYLKHRGVLNVEEFRRTNARGL